jgi:hypothetical protein
VRAQIESGPRAGEPVKGLKVSIAAGDRVGQEVDFVAERKDRATAYLFVQAEHWSRPIARFLRTLDGELAKAIEGADDAAAVAIWLTDDTGEAKQYLPRARVPPASKNDARRFRGNQVRSSRLVRERPSPSQRGGRSRGKGRREPRVPFGK